jgi:hypothetical protein
MLVLGMSIVEGFLAIFLMSPTQFRAFFLLTYMDFGMACLMYSLVTGGRPRYLYESLVFSRS